MESIYKDKNAKSRIEDAAEALEIGCGNAFMEHGQWWFDNHNEMYSVHDASGHPNDVCNGVCFEPVGNLSFCGGY